MTSARGRVQRRSRARSAPASSSPARRSDERDRARDEALHDDLAGVGADARGREARGQQREREGERGAAADQVAEAARGPPRSSRRSARPPPWNSEAAMTSIDMLTRPASAHRDRSRRCAGSAAARARSRVVARRDAVLRQRRVQVDDVRHDRRAEDAGGEQDASRCPSKPGMKPCAAVAGVEADAQRVVEEAERG